MATFILRVQLSKEIDRYYTILRDNLLAIGFTKRVKNNNGIEFRLPNGNYLIQSDKNIDTILSAVKEITSKIDAAPMIFICETKNMAWSGLQRC